MSYAGTATIIACVVQKNQNGQCAGPSTRLGVKIACVHNATPQKYATARSGRQGAASTIASASATQWHSWSGHVVSGSCLGPLLSHTNVPAHSAA